MSRRAIAAIFVLLLGVTACKDDTAPVQPDTATATASSAQAAASGSAQPGTAANDPAAAATGDATAEPSAAASAVAEASDDEDDADEDDAADDDAADDDSDDGEELSFDDDSDDDDDADADEDDDADDDEPAKKVAKADAKPKPAPTVETEGPFVKRDSNAQAAGGAVKAKGPAPAPKKPAAKPKKPAPKKPMATSELKLVKAGSAPRKKLRLQVKKGQVETMKMVLTMDMSVKELKQKQTLPPMAMTMRLKVAETRPNGDIKYNFTLTKTDVNGKGHDPRMVAGMKQAMQKIYGLSGHAVVSDRGMNRAAKINLPPTVDAQTKQVMQGMEQAMQQIGAPLPVEEVGKGARWTYTTKLSQAGVSLKQVATYELVKLEGDKVTLKARVKQSAPKQQIAAPTGQQVSLLKLASKGKGKTRMSLGQLAPSKSTMKLKSTMTMGAGNGKTMSIITGMLIDISSR